VDGEYGRVPRWLKGRGDDLPAWRRNDVHREYREVQDAYLQGRATAEQLRRALERAQAADLL
jgi:hypothetical protein